ncbi:MAG: DNA polymerase II large subunit [archaeon]
MKTEQYFKNLRKEVDKIYSLSEEARAKGLDPVKKVEIPLAMSMAEKVVGLISTIYPQMMGAGIDKRILELEKEYGKMHITIVFKIAEEVAKQKFCKFSSVLEAMDAGIRIGFAYITLGVVSSPIEGFTGLKLRKTKKNEDYIEASFSGPIRSAGTTASCIVLILIDYLRELFGYSKYDPTESEIKRVAAEVSDFHERITNLQYMPTEEEIIFLAKHLPIQIAGEASESLEVSNYKNLERVDTNYLRSGVCLILAEGLSQKAAKGFRLLNQAKRDGVKSTGFDFLEEYIKLHERRTIGKSDDGSPTYIKDLVAGRPVFGHPSRSGGFRFRYGRGRTSGFSAASLHPATMAITDGFIAIGTQLKIEKPTKGTAVTSCDSIDGPIVKLTNGSVRKIVDKKIAKKIYPDVEEILYLGDILFPFSDVANRNSNLINPGYVEEWWYLELKSKDETFAKKIDFSNVSLENAMVLSEKYKIPLHPFFIYYWTQISKESFLDLIEWIRHSKTDKKIIFPYTKVDKERFALGKRALELIGLEHEVTIENVVLSEEDSKNLFVNLGLDLSLLEKEISLSSVIDSSKYDLDKSVLDIINSFSKYKIKDKAGDFIGSRMGRPEKAKLRKLIGSPNVLFPVGSQGGRLRSVQAACEAGYVRGDFPLYSCETCKKETIYPSCEICGTECKKQFYFFDTGDISFNKKSLTSEKEGTSYKNQSVDIPYYLQNAKSFLKIEDSENPLLIKAIRGTSSSEHFVENLCKGILRAKYNLQVNKDGTIRFDATELPLTSFKPKEISVSVDKLRELGYDKDIDGKELIDEEQILELMPHDVLLPSYMESPDEKADDVFIRICNFVDELLVRFYKLKPFYNIKKREDLVGKIGVCMAPHNCAGVICRFIGFSNTLGFFASPYMHAAIRRDCFDYNTYFPVKKNGFWRNFKIGEFVEELNPEKTVDHFGTKEKKVRGFKTISFDKGLKEYNINNFTKHSKNQIFKIKTSLGKSLTVTENHKFLINEKEKRTTELKVGDKLSLSRRIKIKSKEIKEINLIHFLKDENLMVRKINPLLKDIDFKEILSELEISKKQFINFKRKDSYPIKFILRLDKKLQEKIFKIGRLAGKRDNVETPIIIPLTDEFLEIIGLYLAEGYSRSINSKKGLNQVYISSLDRNLRQFIRKVFFDCFGLIPTEKKEDRVTFSSKILYLFFTRILESGSIAKTKRIPYMFLSLPLNRLACVLRGYFEGDGSVSYSDVRVSCDSVSEGLLSDLEFCLCRFGIFVKRYEYEKEPGPTVRKFYLRKQRAIPKFRITKLIIGSTFIKEFKKIGFLSERKNKIFKSFFNKKFYGMRINCDNNFVYDPIISIEPLGERESYCLNVDTKSHLVIANSIVSKQCDGDEAAIMLLGDVLLNFSRKFLPGHRGGTQDAPLVLNAKIDAGEVDDQILDFEFLREYPLELYTLAEKREHSSSVKVNNVKQILKEGKDPFVNIGFTHNTSNFNEGVACSSYKLLATMQEKVNHQMTLVEKIRAVDTADTAKLIIDRHFLRDIKGNLRKFSTQGFRCVECNEVMRRPPISGVCPKCRKGKIIFTIHEGGIKKYLEMAIELSNKYNLSPYIKQNLELTKRYIDSIFGKEAEKQKILQDWFG